jgi:hypothetical protein
VRDRCIGSRLLLFVTLEDNSTIGGDGDFPRAGRATGTTLFCFTGDEDSKSITSIVDCPIGGGGRDGRSCALSSVFANARESLEQGCGLSLCVRLALLGFAVALTGS